MEDKTIWASDGSLSYLRSLSKEDLIDELVARGYDRDMLADADDNALENIIAGDTYSYDGDREDFEQNVAPMIANQCRDGKVILYGNSGRWDGNHESAKVVDAYDLANIGDYDRVAIIERDGQLYLDLSHHDGHDLLAMWCFDENDNIYDKQLEDLGIADEYREFYDDNAWAEMSVEEAMEYFNYRRMNEIPSVLNKIKDGFMKEDLAVNEAKAKDSSELAKEFAEIKELSDEYGKEYLTSMPFTSYDDDPMSIEYQYPEFFRIVKAFFKEMEILSPEELNDSDELDTQWDQGIDQHDWDVLMRACEKLVAGKGVQFEKEYKTGYNSVLDDDEILANREVEEESLDEKAGGEISLLDRLSRLGKWDSYYGDSLSVRERQFDKVKNLLDSYNIKYELWDDLWNSDVISTVEDTPGISMNTVYAVFHFTNDELNKAEQIKESLKLDDDEILDSREQEESLNEDVRFYVDGNDVVDSKRDNNTVGEIYDDGTVELKVKLSNDEKNELVKDLSDHYAVSFLNEDWINPELYKPFGHDSYDSGYVHEPRDPEEDEARVLPPDADDEDWEDDLELDEDANAEMAMHELKDTVANYIYDFYLADVDDNIAYAVHASIPSYDIDWCAEEENFTTQSVDTNKKRLARSIADVLFQNAPRELNI